jgi:hypothetical protein
MRRQPSLSNGSKQHHTRVVQRESGRASLLMIRIERKMIVHTSFRFQAPAL